MTKFQLDITSDVVCPWCYIGHTRLSRAISSHVSRFPNDTFHLIYHPFYLNPPSAETLRSPSFFPSTPPSRSRLDAYAAKFGGAQNASAIFKRLSDAARQDGLAFKFGGKTGPSRNAHRLVRYAQSHGGEDAQNKTMMGLWRRYYEEETDITELDVLVSVGLEAGLGTETEVREYLLAEGGKREEALRDVRDIDRETEEASFGKGISGVPNYEIGLAGEKGPKYEVSGAQDPRLFEAVFGKFREMEESVKVHSKNNGTASGGVENGTELDGEACGIDGKGQC